MSSFPWFKRAISSLLVICILSTNFVYFADTVEAQTTEVQDNFVLLFVEKALFDASGEGEPDLSGKVYRYAEDIQKKLPQTRTAVVLVNETDTVQSISTVLKHLYFEPRLQGNLQGAVFIGETPLPTVEDRERQYTSMYPYTDFIDPVFQFDAERNIFVRSDKVVHEQAEIWHSIIRPPVSTSSLEGRQLLADYFDKNHNYHTGQNAFGDFEEKVFIADIIGQQKATSSIDWNNYDRYMRYMEDREYLRYNQRWLQEIYQEVGNETADLFEGIENPFSQTALLAGSAPDIVSQEIINRYMTPFYGVAQNHIEQWNRLVDFSGRWESKDFDSLPTLIAIRDSFVQKFLREANDTFETEVDNIITANIAAKDTINRKIDPTPAVVREQVQLQTQGTPSQRVSIDEVRVVTFQNASGTRTIVPYLNFFAMSDSSDPTTVKEDIEVELTVFARRMSTIWPDIQDDHFIKQLNDQFSIFLISELVAWKNTNPSQKHKIILEKYLSRDQKVLPVTARDGYELLYLRGNGDFTSMDVSVNPFFDEVSDDPEVQAINNTRREAFDSASAARGQARDELFESPEYEEECGSVEEGVEIWEWFPAVMCWLRSLEVSFENSSCFEGESILDDIDESEDADQISPGRTSGPDAQDAPSTNSSAIFSGTELEAFDFLDPHLDLLATGEDRRDIEVHIETEDGLVDRSFGGSLDIQISDESSVVLEQRKVTISRGVGTFSIRSSTLSGGATISLSDPSGRVAGNQELFVFVWPLGAQVLEFDAPTKVVAVGENVEVPLLILDRFGNVVEGISQELSMEIVAGDADFINDGDFQNVSKNFEARTIDGIVSASLVFNAPGNVTIRAQSSDGLSTDLTFTVLPKIFIKLQQEEVAATEGAYRIRAVLEDENGQQVENASSVLQFSSSDPTATVFSDGGLMDIVNGEGEILVTILDGHQEIGVTATRLGYQPDTLNFAPSPSQAFAVAFEENVQRRSDGSFLLRAHLTDDQERRLALNTPIQFRLTQQSQNAGALIIAGDNEVIFVPNKNTVQASIIALVPGLIADAKDVLIRLELQGRELAEIQPQNLYSMIVGFPAGEVTRDDYFAGWNLFSGKTQAVTAFSYPEPIDNFYLEVWPNGKFKNSQQNVQVRTLLEREYLEFEVSDADGVPLLRRSLIPEQEITVFQNFTDVLDRPEGIYFENLAADQGIEASFEEKQMFIGFGQADILRVNSQGGIQLFDNQFGVSVAAADELEHVVLDVSFGGRLIGRLHYVLQFPYRANDFQLLHSNFRFEGHQAPDEQGSIKYYQLRQEPDTTLSTPAYDGEGFWGDKKQALLFAAQNNLGTATKQTLSLNELFFGDPTVTLGESEQDTNFDFNQTLGTPILTAPEGERIVEMMTFDYEQDGQQDILLRYGTGVIDIFGALASPPYYTARKEFLRFPVAEQDVVAIDIDSDGDDDLLVSFEDGRVSLIENENGSFREYKFAFDVESSISQFEVEDLDADGNEDLVVAFGTGDIYAYFRDADGQIEQVGQLGNFGARISSRDLRSEMLISYRGINAENAVLLDHGFVDPRLAANPQTALSFYPSSNADGVNYSERDLINQYINDSNIPVSVELPESVQQAFFASTNTAPVNATKFGLDLNSGTVNPGDTIQYTITLQSGEFLEGFIWADPVHPHMRFEANSFSCQGCPADFEFHERDGNVFVGNLNLEPNRPIQIQYSVVVTVVPEVGFYFADLPGPQGQADQYPDIVVSSQNQGDKPLVYLISNGPRNYQAGLKLPESPEVPLAELDRTDLNQNGVPDKYEADANRDGEYDFVTDVKQSLNADDDGDGIPNAVDDFPDIDFGGNFEEDYVGPLDWSELTGSSANAFDARFGIRGVGEASFSLPPKVQEFLGKTGALIDGISDTIEKLKCGGGCLAMPINIAYLVPGDINAPFALPELGLGVPVGKAPGTPIIGAPGTGPKPICNGAECYTSGSTWRFYISPTLTGAVALAYCFGVTAPNPVAPIGGRCYVFAPKISPLEEVCDKVNAEVSNFLSIIKSGIARGRNQSIFTVGKGPASLSGSTGSDNTSQGGLEVVLFDLDSYNVDAPKKGRNRRIPSFDEFGGLFTRWWDRQSEEIVTKLLTLPTIHIKLPDFTEFVRNVREASKGPGEFIEQEEQEREKEKLREETKKQEQLAAKQRKVEQAGETVKRRQDELRNIPVANTAEREQKQRELRAAQVELKKVEQANKKTVVDTFYDGLAERLPDSDTELVGGVSVAEAADNVKGVYEWLKSLPLLNIEEKTIVFKYPYLSRETINYLLNELNEWIIDAEAEIVRATAAWTNLTDGCSQAEMEELQLRIEEQGGVENATGRIEDRYKLEQCQQAHLARKVLVDARKLIQTVKENIEILRSYKDFPKQLLRYKYQLVEYLDQVLCYVEKIIDLFGGFFVNIKKRLEQWLELLETIQEIWDTIALIPEIFNDLQVECSLCKNERFSLSLKALLGLLIPELPIIEFPKWPDIILDLTDIDANITIPVPQIEFVAEEIVFPDIPRLRLPDVPNVNIILPGIPLLPRLPELPQLPQLPDLPIPELPDLPPPPKLPEVFAELKGFLELLEKILKLICLINKSLIPINEEELKPTIERLTARNNLMLNLDFLFTLKPDLNLKLTSLEAIEVLFRTKLDLRVGAYYNIVQEIADEWNEIVTDLTGEVNSKTQEWADEFGQHIDQSNLFPSNITIDLDRGSVTSSPSDLGTIDEEIPGLGDEVEAVNERSREIERDLQDAVNPQSLLDQAINRVSQFVSERQELVSVADVREGLGMEPFKAEWAGADPELSEVVNYYKKLQAYKTNLMEKTVMTDDAVLLADRVIRGGNILASQNLAPAEQTESFTIAMEGKNSLLAQNTGVPSVTPASEIPAIDLPPETPTLADTAALYQNCSMLLLDKSVGVVRPFIKYDYEICDEQTSQIFVDADQDGDEDVLYAFGNQVYLKHNRQIPNNPEQLIHYNLLPTTMELKDVMGDYGFADYFEVTEEVNERVVLQWESSLEASVIDVAYSSNLDGFHPDRSTVRHHNILINEAILPDVILSPAMPLEQNVDGPINISYNGETILNIPTGRTAMITPIYSDSTEMFLENGFHYARARLWNTDFVSSPYGEQILLAPSALADESPPIVPLSREIFVPLNTEYILRAGDVLDGGSAVNIAWDINNDGLADQESDQLILGPFEKPQSLEVSLMAIDTAGNATSHPLAVTVFAPRIFMDFLDAENQFEGFITPAHPNVPVTLLRKRFNKWKAVGGDEQHKYYTNDKGAFVIDDLTLSSDLEIKDSAQNPVARHSGSGLIMAADEGFGLRLIPAGDDLPMRLAVVGSDGRIIGNQAFLTDARSDVEIFSEPLSEEQLQNLFGVSVVDVIGDAFEIVSISSRAGDYAGGALIYNPQTQQAVAAIHPQGSIRLLVEDARLELKALEGYPGVLFEVYVGENLVAQVYLPIRSGHVDVLHENWGESLGASLASTASADAIRGAIDIAERRGPELPEFSDVGLDHPSRTAIKTLQERGIVEGYEDGSFQPGAQISRPEFVKIVLGATTCLDCTDPPEQEIERYGTEQPFPDVGSSDWFLHCIIKAKFLEMVEGYGDGFFHPERNISRAEAVAILIRQAGLEVQTAAEAYIDVPDFAWYRDYVYTAVQIGLIEVQGGLVEPDHKVTRAELAEMAVKVIEIKDCRETDSDGDGIPDFFEIENGLDANDRGDGDGDLDGDGISNFLEFSRGLDPNTPDAGISGLGLEPGVGIDFGDLFDGDDLCPEVPKDLTNIEYNRGCPVIADDFFDRLGDLPEGLYFVPGEKDACGGIDFAASIRPGDIFMSAITDRSNQVIFERSREIRVPGE